MTAPRIVRRSVWVVALAAALAIGGAPAKAALDAKEVGAAAVVPFLTGGFAQYMIEPPAPEPEEEEPLAPETPNEGEGAAPAAPSAPASAGSGASAGLPVLHTGDAITIVSVTNEKERDIVLEIRLIEGFSGSFRAEQPGNWDVESYECPMTPHETVIFVIQDGGYGRTDVLSSSLSCNVLRAIDAHTGLVFLSVQGDDGNAIFADWVVVDLAAQFAFGAEAITFQAGPTPNTDDEFRFDGGEYSFFPAALAANFRFPDDGCELGQKGCRSAALMLFSLDGAAGFPPLVQANIDYTDQFGNSFDADYLFRCFTVAYFDEVSPNLTRLYNPGSEYGHMVLRASAAVRSPFHGWIIQSETGGGDSLWVRTLAQSTTNFIPEPGGAVIFNDD